MKARQLIVAPRMPAPPKAYAGSPFETLADVVVDCGEDGCGWHAMGPRDQIKLAWDEHYRMYHPGEVGVLLLNRPRQ
jgi:hypothetical protein